MMLKKGIILFMLLLGANLQLFAQGKKDFSTDPKVFVTDLKNFFSNDKRPDSKEALDKFTEQWEANAFTPSEQDGIIAMCNRMLAERLRTYPEFTSYLNMLLSYKSGKLSEDKLTQYHKVANTILDKDKRNLTEYTNIISDLFGQFAINKGDVKNWIVSNQDYSLGYDSSPVISFPAVELMLVTKEDTLGIYQTTGKFYPMTDKWYGKGGTVYWTRVGFPKEQVNAKLNRYSLNVKDSKYSADSVLFVNTKVFSKPVLGHLEDMATTNFLGEKASYPRFRSYQNVLSLKNVFKNIDYQGGFTLEGAQIYGTGNDSNRAIVTIKYNGKVVMRALSKTFVISPDKLVSSKAAVSVYMDKDSLYHTQLIFNYQDKSRLLTLSRDKEGLYASPFFDSYHQMEMTVGNLLWDLDSSSMNFKTITNPGAEAMFESSDYFNEWTYLQMQGVLDYNPLDKIKRYVDTYKQVSISVQDLANFFNSKPEFMNNLLFMLANNGFIFYDYEGQRVVVKRKLLHYVLAYKKLSDYDNLHFSSVISAHPNASLDLTNNDLKVEGVGMVTLSDSQTTYAVPREQTIRVQKNRNIDFSGTIHSGRFDFYGNTFLFDYANFKVVLSNVDSVKFKFPEYGKDGQVVKMHMIQNSLQNVNGFLYIDQPNNKSGLKPVEEFPIFECNRESYCFYDKPYIFKGVYKKDRFYFQINPFTIKNLDKFTAEGLQFPGTFVSAGILPVFPYALTIQEDYSLGFKIESPATGYKLYKDKGVGKGLFMLSNKGLRAKGEIDYLASITNSDNIILFPDSMNSSGSKFVLQSLLNGKYPPVLGPDVVQHWMPYKDSMFLSKGKEPMKVYDGKIDFSGSLILTPNELVGSGNMIYQTLHIDSKAISFLPKAIKSASGDIKINSPESKRVALKADDVSVDLDLAKDFGKFQSNVDTSKVQLPDNKFSTTLNRFTVDLKGNNISFEKNKNLSNSDAYFVSNNPDQQYLKFQSEKAVFDLNKSNITAQDVPFIIIADSRIYTPNKELIIEKEGSIASIKGAIIVTSDQDEYHRIYDAFVNVFSKTKFAGYGSYDYIDKNNKKFKLLMNDIRTTEAGNTIAKANIMDTAKFFLTPGIRYMGTFTLMSTKKKPSLDGYILPDVKQKRLRTEWVKFADTIDAQNIALNITAPKSKDGKDLLVGTFISGDSTRVYNLLYGKKYNPVDQQIFSTSGVLIYDEQKDEFRIGPDYKVFQAETEDANAQGGNLFVYRPANNEVYTEGAYDLGTAAMKNLSILTAGTYTFNYRNMTNLFDMAMILDFPMNEEAAKLMTDSFVNNSFNAPQSDLTKKGLANAFALLIKDKKDRGKLLNELVLNGYVPNIDETNKTFIFTDVKLSYNDSLNSFVSGGRLSLANSYKAILNKDFGGVMQVTHGKTGDRFGLLIESEPGSYHYFYYDNNVLSYLSSDYIFIDKVTQTASKLEKGKNGWKLKQAKVDEVGAFYQLKDVKPDGSK